MSSEPKRPYVPVPKTFLCYLLGLLVGAVTTAGLVLGITVTPGWLIWVAIGALLAVIAAFGSWTVGEQP